MPRGQKANIGDRKVNRNRYEYIKTADGWKGSHVVLMEEHLGRPLAPGEYIEFVNGHEPPVTLEMIRLRRRGDHRSSVRARLAQIDTRLEELQAEKDILLKELNNE